MNFCSTRRNSTEFQDDRASSFKKNIKRRQLREKAAALRYELRQLIDKRAEADPNGTDPQMQLLTSLQERHRWTNTLASETHAMVKQLLTQQHAMPAGTHGPAGGGDGGGGGGSSGG